jgi:hypothetical protein
VRSRVATVKLALDCAGPRLGEPGGSAFYRHYTTGELGGSSGINIAGAIRLARELGLVHTIVTILCDGGSRYQSKLFNPDFLRGKGLPVPGWL